MNPLSTRIIAFTIAAAATAVTFGVHAAPPPADQEIALLRLEIKQLEAIKRERSRAVRLEKLQARKAKLEAAIAQSAPATLAK